MIHFPLKLPRHITIQRIGTLNEILKSNTILLGKTNAAPSLFPHHVAAVLARVCSCWLLPLTGSQAGMANIKHV